MKGKPFTKRQRQWLSGYRPCNDWGSGDLPCPWAAGDLLVIPADAVVDPATAERIGRYPANGPMLELGDRPPEGSLPGHYVVTYTPSIDEGDAWYCRVISENGTSSDRLHVAFAGRCSWDAADCVNFMAPFTLVETSDPEGLALREKMLADGWEFTAPGLCPACDHRLPA